jgi:hypothetical protein
MDERSGSDDAWDERSKVIGPAILRVFPATVFDQARLQLLIEEASRPARPKGGLFARICAGVFSFGWVDDELPSFLKLLQDHNWTKIDWNENWVVIPLLPKAVFDYCLPGIMYWITMDSDMMFEAAESLVRFHLAPRLTKAGEGGFDFSAFNSDQRQWIGAFLLLLHDLSFADQPGLQQRIQGVAQSLLEKEPNVSIG